MERLLKELKLFYLLLNLLHMEILLYMRVYGKAQVHGLTITTLRQRWSLKPLENLEIQEYGSRCQNKIPIDSVDFDFKTDFEYHPKM